MKTLYFFLMLCVPAYSIAAITVTVTCPAVGNIYKMRNTGSSLLLSGTPWTITADKDSTNISQDYPGLTQQAVALDGMAYDHTRITCTYSSSNNNKLIFVAKVATSNCSRQNDSTVICQVESNK